MLLVDTHCHLDVAAFDADRTAVMQRSAAMGVTDIVVPGIVAADWAKLLTVCAVAQSPKLHSALGLHPLFLQQHQLVDLDHLANAVRDPLVIAVGEIGLDFFSPNCDSPRQQELFAAQLAIAQDADLPVLLHVRRAHDAALLTLRRFPRVTGIVHAFNGSSQQAAHYLARSFKLGFGGMLTFERASKLRRLAAELPLDAIVLETDAPNMTGAAHRGERNSPEYLPEVLATLAALRHTDAATIAAATTANARAVLHLP